MSNMIVQTMAEAMAGIPDGAVVRSAASAASASPTR